MNLAKNQQRHLKKLAHHLKPVVSIGQAGLTTAVLVEIDIALSSHELTKVKISGADRDDRKAMIDKILEESGSTLIQAIGHIAAIYRANPERKYPLILPKAE